MVTLIKPNNVKSLFKGGKEKFKPINLLIICFISDFLYNNYSTENKLVGIIDIIVQQLR